MKSLICMVLLSLLSLQSLAETAVCKGKLIKLGNHQPGAVYVNVEGSKIMAVCKLDQQFFRTSPESCK